MAYILAIILCLLVLGTVSNAVCWLCGARATDAGQADNDSHQRPSATALDAQCGRLLRISNAISGGAANVIYKPSGLANRGAFPIGRQIKDKLRARIAAKVLRDPLRAHPDQSREFDSHE